MKILDKYIIKKFLTTYFFLILIVIPITIIFDYNENIDKMTQSGVTTSQIAEYYLNFAPYFANLYNALFLFIAVIFFTSKLADKSEIIAMKAAGMSFKRLLRPYMIAAAIIAALTFVLGAYVIPKGQVYAVNFKNKYIRKKSITSVDNIQMQVDTGVVAYISHFDDLTKSGYGFSLDKFVGKKLVSHLTAQNIQYDTLADRKNSWSLRMYQIRTLQGQHEQITRGNKLDTVIQMEPRDFYFARNQQETLTLPELSEFIDKQRNRGAAGLAVFEVEYHKRFAMPFAAFILTVIGVALSCTKRKNGMGAALGVGIALCFTYILFQTVCASFAVNAGWSPMLSAWLPNIVFAVVAFILYKRTPE